MFLRGHGSQEHSKNNGSRVGVTATSHASGKLGIIQGDGMRMFCGATRDILLGYDLTGWNSLIQINEGVMRVAIENNFPNPVFSDIWMPRFKIEPDLAGFDKRKYVGYHGVIGFDSRFALPTANEIRPSNIAVKYIIKVK